jgi:hypothetical protein
MMFRSISSFFAIVAFAVVAASQTSFTLESSERQTITSAGLAAQKELATRGKIDGNVLTFSAKDIRLVVTTGPEDDMLSYRIQGLRNPAISVPEGAILRILFVNSDVDMRHDIRFGISEGEFVLAPDIGASVGSQRLTPRSEDEAMQAEELVIKAAGKGNYRYFCSVRGHARSGMWGTIAVGVKAVDTTPAAVSRHGHRMPGTGADAAGGATMASTVNIGDPMERESSGTSWNPDSTPVYAYMREFNDGGMFMLMGSAFLRYTRIGGEREVSVAGKGSRSRPDAPTMLMLMYSKPLAENTQFGFRTMISADPIIQKGWGYPLLFQSGELYKGQPIHDRQHPHDLFSELSVAISHRFGKGRSVYLYADYPGEPALGPPAFMHRVSAMNNPDAPISHHWQDATHITWGVITGGVSVGKAKIEASVFNGREPDENRWNFDKPRLNSFSGRFSFNPTKNWALQISHGYLRDPEPFEPEIRILRKTSASAIFNKPLNNDRNFAASLIWGRNYANGEGSDSYLAEANYDWARNAVFSRYEIVNKSGHDLVLEHPLEHDSFWVRAFSLGYLRDIYSNKGIDVGVGSMFTVSRNPEPLRPVYGGTTHGGWQVFMRFRPSKLKMH